MSSSKYAVRLLPIAEEDLDGIVSYIAADRPASAYRFAATIEKNLERLSSHPHLGKVPNDEKLSAMGYRFIVVGNHLIFYTIRPKTVLVHRIIHGARDIQHLL
ncbi:MAG: type II toxin-antitoxin system RelE/ParE family toxin [Candidatus Manganitrophaceae bacterium]